MREPYLSVIIPTFNESKRIPGTLHGVLKFLMAQEYLTEVIISDDGSTDGTPDIALDMLRDFPHDILVNPVNTGKGNAVKRGMLRGKGEFLLFSDADLSTPIEEAAKFIQILKSGFDVVIGSRALRDSNLEIRQGRHRELMGKTFNKIARIFTFHGIHDSQCGFKCFRREVGHDLFGQQKLDGFSFDAEILYLAQKRGYRVCEAPVTWRHSADTRVRLYADPLWMFLDLVRIPWIHRGTWK